MKRTLFPAAGRYLLTGAALFLALSPASAEPPAPDLTRRFTRAEVQIAMRDGVRLNTAIYTPRDKKGPLPFVLLRTPYGIERGAARAFPHYLKDLADEGYIFVFQDIRGRYK